MSTEVQVSKPTLTDQIKSMREQFQLAMPRGAEAAQLIRDALTMLRVNPKLGGCEPQSVLGALMTCAQLNLRVGVLGQAWVLPFWSLKNRRFDGQLVIGYQGYKELALRSGFVSSVIARPRHANDIFSIDYGSDHKLIHKPALDGPRGDIVGYYSIIRYINGDHEFDYMSQAEIDEHRDRYAMTRDKEKHVYGVWLENPEGMALKTVFLKLVKWAPKSPEVASALDADGSIRVDLSANSTAPETDIGEDRAVTTEETIRQLQEPAGQLTAVTTDERDGSPLDRGAVMQRMQDLLTEGGLKGDADGRRRRVKVITSVLELPVTNTNQLTAEQMGTVVGFLERCKANNTLPMTVRERSEEG